MKKAGKSFLFPIFLLFIQTIALITVAIYYCRILPDTVPFFYDHGGQGVVMQPKKLFFALQLLLFLVVCMILLLLAGLSLTILPMRCMQPFLKTNGCDDEERVLREFVCKTILWTCVFTAQFLIEAYLVNFEMAQRGSPEIFYWFWIAAGSFLVEIVGLISYRYYRHHCFLQSLTKQAEQHQSDSIDLWCRKKPEIRVEI